MSPSDGPDDAAENWQLKVDEVTALSAIFDEDFQIIALQGVWDDTYSPQLSPEMLQDLPPPHVLATASIVCSISVEALLPSCPLHLLLQLPNAQDTTDAPTDVGASVKALPPFALKIHMGPGYPSRCPPVVTIQALWLSAGAIQRLQQQLGAAWEEQGPGTPICYSWVDWLKHSALDFLGASTALLVPSHALSMQGPPAEQVLMHLLRYDAVQDAEAFKQASWQCSICFDEVHGSACVQLDCRHHFCSACLSQDCRLKVQDGAVDKLKCPDPSCGQPLPPSLLKTLLSQEEYLRWEELLLARTLESMQDVSYCPRCSTLTIEDPDHCAQCAKCLFVFCSLCNDSWHPGSECMNLESKLQVMQQRRDRAAGSLQDEAARRAQADLANQLLSLQEVRRSSRQCPRCRIAIEKTFGCNKMTCTNCSALFCYRCGVAVQGYEHFGEARCRLFDPEEIAAWEAGNARNLDPLNAPLPLGHVAAQLAANNPIFRLCRCPVCGQQNLKEGHNNAMRCWACTCHFCYVCHAALRGRGAVGQHFTRSQNGLKPCRQHTID